MTLAALWRAVCRRWLVVALSVVAVEIVALSLKPLLPRVDATSSVYVSSAKLLLRPTSPEVTSFGRKVKVNPHDSETGRLWFIDFRGVQDILASQEYLDSVAARLPDTSSQQVRGCIVAYPSSIGLADLSTVHDRTEREGAEKALASYEEELSERLGKRETRRLELITFSVMEQSPDRAQCLASVAVDEFLKAARKAAAREYTERRLSVEEMLRHNQEQSRAAEGQLKKLGGAAAAEEASMEGDSQRQLASLGARRARVSVTRAILAGQLADLKKTADPDGALLSPALMSASEKEQAEHLQVLTLAKIYKPDDPYLARARQKQQAFASLTSEIRARLARSEVQEQESALQILDAELAEIDQETAAIKKRIPSGTQSTELRQILLRLKLWESTRLELMGALYEARLQERQALAQGTLVVLQKPQPGTRPPGSSNPGKATLLVMLPVGLFLGVTLAGLVDAWQRSRYAADRIASELRVELLAALPRVSQSRDSNKNRGRNPSQSPGKLAGS